MHNCLESYILFAIALGFAAHYAIIPFVAGIIEQTVKGVFGVRDIYDRRKGCTAWGDA